MILNCTVTVQNGQQEVTFVSGNSWQNLFIPAFMALSGPNVDPTKFWIADVDNNQGQWLMLTQPWPGATGQVSVVIFSDFTPGLNLPLANPGDVNIADLWNRAMVILDNVGLLTGVAIHGPTHVGNAADPVPLASTTYSGLLCQVSGLSTDYVGGDNQTHPLTGLPTGSMILWPISALPTNFLACDGGQYSRVTYANLYAFLGGALSPWGQGDGHSTFNTPDFRGRVPMGAGNGPGLSTRGIGQMFGEEQHALTIAEMPTHFHSYTYDGWLSTGGHLGFTSGTYKLTQAEVANTGSVGGSPGGGSNGAPHNNIQPSTVIQIIIRI